MDLKKEENKELLLEQIDTTLEEYNSFLKELANGDKHQYHRSALLTYWLTDYLNYVKREDNFDPRYLKLYNRGDILSVDFGYKLGREFGGRHYAVVIEDSTRTAPNVVVLPLRSFKDKDKNGVHYTEINLGNELYYSFSRKKKQVFQEFEEAFKNVEVQKKDLEESIDAFSSIMNDLKNDAEKQDSFERIRNFKTKAEKKLRELKQAEEILNDAQDAFLQVFNQFRDMKEGSIAMVKQITTISKMRILNPLSEKDALADIKLSSNKLNIIDEQIKKFFTH